MARPKGSLNLVNFDKRALDSLKAKAGVITAAVIEQALMGCTQSQKIILDKLLPNLKPESKRIEFSLDEKGSLSNQASDILMACSNGHISHEAASSLISSLSGIMKIREIEDLEIRLTEIEARLAK